MVLFWVVVILFIIIYITRRSKGRKGLSRKIRLPTLVRTSNTSGAGKTLNRRVSMMKMGKHPLENHDKTATVDPGVSVFNNGSNASQTIVNELILVDRIPTFKITNSTLDTTDAASPEFQYPFIVKPLLSKRELGMYELLMEIHAGTGLNVFVKVKLIDLIETDGKQLSFREKMLQNNRIKELHLDFVVVDSKCSTVKYVLELDDSSHNSTKVQHRDQKKENALRKAGVNFVRIPQGYYTKESVQKKLDELHLNHLTRF